MTDRDALYQAICAQPDEDTPRLAYADWLEENGQPYEAEYIRVQCRLSQHPYDDPAYPELLERFSDLATTLTLHDRQRPLTLPAEFDFRPYTPNDGPSRHWEDFSRGFLDRCYHSESWNQTKQGVKRFAKTLEQLIATSTIRTLQVNFCEHLDALGEFLSLPVVEKLRGLVIDRGEKASERAEANEVARLVAESPRLKNLRRLDLLVPVGESGLKSLATAKYLGNLESLLLRTPNLTPEGLNALSRAAWFRNLRGLIFDGYSGEEPRGIPAEAVGEIGNFPELPQLASFHLEWADLSPGAAGKVAGSKSFPRLAKLSINNTEMGPDGMRELRAASNWPLRHLHLKGCPRMGDAGALGLAKSPLVAGLRVLCLDHCGIGPKGAAALAKSALLAGVRHLDLSHNFIGGAGLKALATSKHLRGLRSLDLINSWGDPVCKPAEGAAFMAALRMPELHSLAMWGVAIGGRGAKVVAESSRFSNLTVLMLESCGVTDAAARAIFEAPHLQQIINLNLFGNKLAHSAELLTRPEIMPKLARALLSVHQVPQELIDRLIKRPGLEVYIKTGVGTSRLATGEGESS